MPMRTSSIGNTHERADLGEESCSTTWAAIALIGIATAS
jgi:hypothetical protein